MKLLIGRRPQTVTELVCHSTVTRTAVAEQLNELLAAGLVERSQQSLTGRGRPRHVYSATDTALLSLFAGNHSIVGPAIWRSLYRLGGKELKERVLELVSREVAAHYAQRVDGATPAERFRQLSEMLRRDGELVEIERDRDGRLVMSKRSCGFFSMFEEGRSVCAVDEEMTRRVVGAPVERKACRHDGDACCQFVLLNTNGHV